MLITWKSNKHKPNYIYAKVSTLELINFHYLQEPGFINNTGSAFGR